MDEEHGLTAGDRDALERALDEALQGLDEPIGVGRPDAGQERWLRVGLRIGLGRPALAGRLLELTHAGTSIPSSADGPSAAEADARASQLQAVTSMLARSAAMPLAQRREVGPEVTFGWATRLGAGEVLALGSAVRQQLDAGDRRDVGKAFGIAWDDGVRMERLEREAMMGEFIELQEAIGSALAGRDLREPERAPRSRGLGGVLDQWIRGSRAERSPAASIVEESGERGRYGLVAAWNAWVALRYRAIMPTGTFELLVHPWVTAVGPIDAP